MGIFSFFRDIVGTRKDLVETTKAKLEAEQLREAKSPIQKATLDDVKKYDPKTQKLLYKIGQEKDKFKGRKRMSTSLWIRPERLHRANLYTQIVISCMITFIIVLLTLIWLLFFKS